MPAPQAIRAVAFDIGNVLIDWTPDALVDPFSSATGLPGDQALMCVFQLYTRPKKRLDLGDLAPREFHAELNAIVAAAGGKSIAYQDFLRLWCATIRPRPGATAIVRRVRDDLRIGVWSNTDPVHFGCYSAWLPALASARSLSLSFLLGLEKPDPAFFREAIAALDVAPEEIVFLDDTTRHVEGARALGVEAVQVAALREVELALEARGLLR